jgi:hypothetical protein
MCTQHLICVRSFNDNLFLDMKGSDKGRVHERSVARVQPVCVCQRLEKARQGQFSWLALHKENFNALAQPLPAGSLAPYPTALVQHECQRPARSSVLRQPSATPATTGLRH